MPSSRFKIWFENSDLTAPASGFAPLTSTNPNWSTVASDEVKRTGLQPQVDSENDGSVTDDHDSIAKLDDEMQKIDSAVAKVPDSASDKVMQFKSEWERFKEKWDQIKTTDSPETSQFRSNPNSMPEPTQPTSSSGRTETPIPS